MTKKEEKNTLNEVIKALNEEYGSNSVMKIGDSKPIPVDVIPTGSFALNLALGVGGLPRGRIVEIYGPESGGKTTLALSVIANAQKDGGVAAFVDVECAFDPIYAAKIGVDTPKLILNQPNSAEEALNVAEKLIRSGGISVIVIDSVAALVPKQEAEADIGVQTMGLQARFMSQAMRKLVSIVSETNTLVVFINQVRMKIGQAWGNPETTTGGNALKFYSSVRIDIRRVSTIKDDEESIGILVRAKVQKNKVAPPFKQAEFCLMFDGGISISTDIFNIGLEKGIIEKKGNTYSYNEHKLGIGLKNAIIFIKDNVKIAEEIKEEIINHA